MNYIYDVILNLRKDYYDFFFWEEDDELLHISKIPVVKVDSTTMIEFLKNDIKVHKDLLNLIKNKAVLYEFNKRVSMPYLVIFTDSKYTLVLEFDYNGLSINRSSLLFDEELDALSVGLKINTIKIDYEKIKKKRLTFKLTRNELKIQKFLKRKLSNIFKYDHDKLKYLHYEVFSYKEDNISKVMKNILLVVNNNDDSKIKVLNDVLNLIDTK